MIFKINECVFDFFFKVKNTHDVISNGIYEMTSSLEKTRDFEKTVIFSNDVIIFGKIA